MRLSGEPSAEEVLPAKHRAKKKGQRDLDLKDFPEEILPPYSVSEEQLDAFYGKGNWRRMPDETYKRLCHEPESWTVEIHTVEVYVGTDGDHQDEFLRGNRPKDMLRKSIVTPSLLASILNVRRRFDAALTALKKDFTKEQLKKTTAYQAMSRIGILYKIEEMIKDKTLEDASIIVYSITKTALLNGIKPYLYLTCILDETHKMEPFSKAEELDSLLPWPNQLAEEFRIA